MNLYPNFAEGDSGVPMSPVIATWNKIQEGKAKKVIRQVSAMEFQAEVFELARDKSQSGETRASAYKLVWEIGAYRAMSEAQSNLDTQNDFNGLA